MIGIFIKHRHLLGYGLMVLAFAATVFYLINVGYQKCETDRMIKTLTIVEKRNEIANNRPDTARFLDGLLNDPDW